MNTDETRLGKNYAKTCAFPMRLTDRDKKLLALLATYGCVGVKRIKSELWNERENLRSHYRRLGVLTRAGFIEKVSGDQTGSIGYRITRKGKLTLTSISNSNQIPIAQRSYKTQFEHDQLLIDIRRILNKSPVVRDYKTEAEVRFEIIGRNPKFIDWKQIPTIPDATFVFTVPGRTIRVAIELELSGKSKARYRRIFRNHLLSQKWSVVFYIVKAEKLMDHLKEQLQRTRQTDPQTIVAKRINGIYFCSLEAFLSLGLFAPFSNGDEEISLGDISRNYQLEAAASAVQSTASTVMPLAHGCARRGPGAKRG